MPDLNDLGTRFLAQLTRAEDAAKNRAQHQKTAEKIHVVGAGATLSTVYEQLRNAAEYTEEHLLLQRAIRRFYRRLFLSRDQHTIARSGEELIVELTLAGYLKNDSIPATLSTQITELAQEYLGAINSIGANGHSEEWTIHVLAVRVERLLNEDAQRQAFVQFAHEHFLASTDQKALFGDTQADFEVALFVAVHRALLHSDTATIRTALLERYGLTPSSDLERFVAINKKIDELLASKTTEKTYRYVNRQGAPFRVLWRMIEDQPNFRDIIRTREVFLRAYENQVNNEYNRIHDRINRGVVKSVIFLIITKFLVGIAVEVPYDIALHGAIVWLPLIVNLAFPPIYMILLRATLVTPGYANTAGLVDRMSQYLYGQDDRVVVQRSSNMGSSTAYNTAYAIFFLAVLGGVSWLLFGIGFSLLHLLIFIVFLSTASFLGFRLSGMIRELEVVESSQSGITIVRDFLYMPFVVVGRWISEKYARVNVIASLLDMVIELPLKTVLRLIRQWSLFISAKKDEL